MATSEAADSQILLRDDFNAPVNPTIWHFNQFSPVNNPSFYGRTQQRQSFPAVSNGLLHLQLDAFNPTAIRPGDSFVGSEIISNQAFAVGTDGGIAFEAKARVASLVPGIVGGIFGYGVNSTLQNNNEADFEALTNVAVGANNTEETNVYSQEPLGIGHPQIVPIVDLTSFHTFRIEWFPNQVRWFIDGTCVRTDNAHVPVGTLALHLNIWAPTADFAAAFSSALRPATSATSNQTFFIDVDYAQVSRLAAHNILWQNDNSTVALWEISGTSLVGGGFVGIPGSGWQAKSLGDFNGDGAADILWQSDNGTVAVWELSGTDVLRGAVLGNPGLSWHVKFAGDFNGDGKSDILWQNDDGSVAVWEVSSTDVLGGGVLGNPGPTWHVKGTGDFNGDGRSDILWQNDDGSVAVWKVSGTDVLGGGVLGNPGLAWHVKGSGDFNGDGTSDILWQNDDGSVAIWELSGAGVLGGAVVGNPGPNWHVKDTGDFNGDGKSDILWQNNDGSVAVWEMSGTGVLSGSVVGPSGPGWHTVTSDNMRFIDGTGTATTLTATSVADEFVLTSYAAGTHVINGFNPANDIIELSKSVLANFGAVQAHSAASAGGTLITLDSTSSLLVTGVTPGALHANNFVFV